MNCQVCGNPGARLHYRGRLCGRCRVFFIRCAKEQPLTCIGNQNCQITTTKRKNCAYCRFQKCRDLNMDLDKVGKQRTYKTGIFHFQPGFIRFFMKVHHKPLLGKEPVIVPASLQTIVLLHEKSLNESGPSPNLFTVNMDIPLLELLQEPTLCTSRDSACFDDPSGMKPEIQYDLRRTVGRWVVSIADFLKTTYFFDQLSPGDKEILCQHVSTTFFVLTRLENQMKKRSSLKELSTHINRFPSTSAALNLPLGRFVTFLNNFITDRIDPLRKEMGIGDFELSSLKIISMFPNQDGKQKTTLAREFFTKQLADYIADAVPEQSRSKQLARLKALLDLGQLTRDASRLVALTFEEIVSRNYEQMLGRMPYDLFLKQHPGL